VWQGFAEWRGQFYRALSQIDSYYLKLLHDEVQHVLADIEHEIAIRPQ